MTVEELQRKPSKNKPQSVEDIRKAAATQRLRPARGKSHLIEVGRKLSDSKQSPESRKTVSGVASESSVVKVKQVQPKPVRVKSKPIVVQSQPAGVSSPGKHSPTDSPGFHLSDALNDESSSSPQLISERKKTQRSTGNTDSSKNLRMKKTKKRLSQKKSPNLQKKLRERRQISACWLELPLLQQDQY